MAVDVLRELGIATEELASKSLEPFANERFDWLITVCDGAAEACPTFASAQHRLHWPTDDPALARGLPREQLVTFRRVRDELRWRIRNFLSSLQDAHNSPRLAMDRDTIEDAQRLIRLALAEDLGNPPLDATSAALVPNHARVTAALVARSGGVISGTEIGAWVAQAVGDIAWSPLVRDGDRLRPLETIGVLRGSGRGILAAERTFLNFLGRMCGVATLTRHFVDLTAGTLAKVYDTRKTIPGWRRLDKYAVRCGGGWNHRLGLHDAILIKDNHLVWLRKENESTQTYISRAVANARQWVSSNRAQLLNGDRTVVQIEVDRLDQLDGALEQRPDMILLDNFELPELRIAVERRNQSGLPVELEASGGVTLNTIAAIAATGVDRISVGALTHSAPNLDVALDWELPTTSH